MNETLARMLHTGASTVFQPIYDIRAEDRFTVWAVEALTRGPAGTHFERSPIFFEYVRFSREEAAVDRWCVAAAMATFARYAAVPRLSVNVHASTLERDPGFASFVASTAAAVQVELPSLIVEIVEQAPYFDAGRVLRNVNELRSHGVSIAIDDVGLGHGNFRTILDLQPDYLKIDHYFVGGVASDGRRRSLIASTLAIASDFGALVIGEGVEDAPDAALLREMGVPLVQGFLLGCPQTSPLFEDIDLEVAIAWPGSERLHAGPGPDGPAITG